MPLKNPQSKGRRGEYFVRDILRAHGYQANRNPMSGAIEWLKGDIRTNFPFFVEVKNTEITKFHDWYRKAKNQAGPQPPIIIWVNNQRAYCFLDLVDLLAVLADDGTRALSVPGKPIKLAPEDVAWQGPLSKFAMSHRKAK